MFPDIHKHLAKRIPALNIPGVPDIIFDTFMFDLKFLGKKGIFLKGFFPVTEVEIKRATLFSIVYLILKCIKISLLVILSLGLADGFVNTLWSVMLSLLQFVC